MKLNRIAIIPSFQKMRAADWPAQVCAIEGGNAVYVNNSTEMPISHPKFAHFKTLPVVESSTSTTVRSSKVPVIQKTPVSMEALLSEITINEKLLDKDQLARLKEIHIRNRDAFDGDLKGGYNHKRGRYTASFSFKENSKPPPLKVWVPQYNRASSELLQAKCDQLESRGVLKDPTKLNFDTTERSGEA